MTEQRRKEWLFDRDEFILKAQLFQCGIKGQDSVFEFIQSEIERNRKDAVREFAAAIRPDFEGEESRQEMLTNRLAVTAGIDHTNEQMCIKIDAALKDRGIE